mmetsp:Transcript_6551/g.5881  ORF Transcript_6551/g.5881 Transcript_6551/m.5881 type:complete len:84 (-) Transcript_6551:324-575(-)
MAESKKQGKKSAGNDTELSLIKKGFTINSLSMGNAETGEKIWETKECAEFHDSSKELKAEIPKKILKCRVVSRDVNFSSEEKI